MPSPWVTNSSGRSGSLKSAFSSGAAKQSFIFKVIVAAALGCLVSLVLVIKSSASSSSASIVNANGQGGLSVQRNWKNDLISHFPSAVADHQDLSFAMADEIPSLLEGTVGFQMDLSKSYLERQISLHQGNSDAREYYGNMLLRVQEMSNWGKQFYATKVACMIALTGPAEKFLFNRVVSTFGELCEKVLVFIPRDSSVQFESELNSSALENMKIVRLDNKRITDTEGKDNSWERTHRMWKHVAFDPELQDIDWFIKTDKFTYPAIGALKDFLRFYNPNVYHYVGHTLMYQASANIIFNSGTCYVLSRSAMQRLVKHSFVNMVSVDDAMMRRQHYACVDRPGGGEDTLMGVCLRSVGINPENTMDEQGRQRFLVYRYGGHRIYEKSPEHWFWKHKPDGNKDLEECCVAPNEVVSEGGFGDNPRDDRDFRRVHRKHIRQRQSEEVSGSRHVPPQSQYFLYDGKTLQLDKFGNYKNIPNGQKIFNGFSDA
eukprot:TRINITY_DN8654_c0_g1_i1.p1 TRINITY_DN8654_c0_g1~~TRINITY_DN8654_c0_g1_i1.p1  ORF type:complete len:488 (-),score=122.07 TRINITY_DN8654_c0_g1_i1:42-1505(-)